MEKKSTVIVAAVIVLAIIFVVQWVIKINDTRVYLMEETSSSYYVLGAEKAGKTRYTKNLIKTIEFVGENQEPNDYIESWDVSRDEDESIIAYISYSGISTSTNTATSYVLYISGKDTIALTSGKNLFKDYTLCQEIKGLNKVDTSEVTDISYMFSGCSNLRTIDFSNFDTTNVTNMDGIFDGCDKLSNELKDMVLKTIETEE